MYTQKKHLIATNKRTVAFFLMGPEPSREN